MQAKRKSKYRHDFEYYFHSQLGYKILADEHQYRYVESILAPTSEVQAVFSDSPAGSGKTALALAAAYYLLKEGEVNSIAYVRNTVSVRENGFLPGTIEDKERAYMQPAEDNITRIGASVGNQDLYNELVDSGQLFCTSTSFLRGVDYKDNMVLIIDEAQNLDLVELQTVLTRPHDNVKIIVIGSSLQNDNCKVKKYGPNRLLPFQVYMEHFENQEHIPIQIVKLVNNYRGRFSQFADSVGKTLKQYDDKA